MSSPVGIFIGLDQATLLDLKADMIQRLKTGVFTGVSGAGKSSTSVYPAQSMQEVKDYLKEINYALNSIAGIKRPQKVEQCFDLGNSGDFAN